MSKNTITIEITEEGRVWWFKGHYNTLEEAITSLTTAWEGGLIRQRMSGFNARKRRTIGAKDDI